MCSEMVAVSGGAISAAAKPTMVFLHDAAAASQTPMSCVTHSARSSSSHFAGD